MWGFFLWVFFLCVFLKCCDVSGEVSQEVSEVELQRQVLDAMNYVLYEQLKYKGNEVDYYNSLNSYIRQVSRSALNKLDPKKELLF